ncbi:3-beta hydroxysteroid dehydrogenase [Mycobacterium colombiense]|uniref:3-beta hydroxysteroid dehydrogenase n=1 Tax=Mycobacterium colombiense TaxID=339268 RepID=A0A1A0VE50_9MYCO|nr:SDR family oxidoreductase [Mycobacterium colombiense]OBB81479.1 3-beta hydroxysteroid dehydrogenase [Mycobacterium colombiense]
MRVFITGATGFIGSAVVAELLADGHDVLGLARSDAGAQALQKAGAQVHRGDIEDLNGLRRAAADADGVIHTAFFHGISHPGISTRLRIVLGGSPRNVMARFAAASVGADLRAIETFGAVLEGTGRPLVVAFPTMALASGHLVTEQEAPDPGSPGAARIPSEEAALALASRGVRASVLRIPPSVHGHGDAAMVPRLIGIARKKRASAYVGDGQNRWPAVHRSDAAHLFTLALHKGSAGPRYHAVAEDGVPMRAIAAVIAENLDVPITAIGQDKASAHFGWLAPFVSTDNHVSSTLTQQELGWRPTQPGLLTDLNRAGYFTSA